MPLKNYLPYLNIILLLALGAYVFYPKKPGNNAYILNQEVFDQFKGKQELEKKLNDMRVRNKTISDSMITLLNNTRDMQLVESYKIALQNIEITEENLSTTYTADIWKRINQYVVEYGKEQNYDFIFGASGNGALMYANESKNVTADVVKYINAKYEGD